jgi:arsenate reductase
VVEAMREAGVDLSSRTPRLLDDVLAEQKPAMLITMGCGEQCPFVPGVARDDWPLPDPKGATLEATRAIRDEIRARVEALLVSHGWK